ncbi:23S rRNA pseudouridine(955/2504/2580) synthase RluC [Agitococcus lubricus]|uniref:Pseudouridine synthase n=1 Tax=Agitococcus lubricus TaxID=1077255 RepID=A0A2T5J1S1_9GAMM|nr:23S rRNA pseudouridine(955/2504/2580) synthase RluC [Agitococcus lubricus]PTQ90384.1 ribosomal large subunit pseudouridine synthase C [Agitococcus lubricus]
MTEQHSNQQVRLLTVSEHDEGQRLDNFLITALKGAPRTLVYRIVRKGEVRVNKGRSKPEYRLQIGDVVRIPPIRLSEESPAITPSPQLSQHLSNRIIYHKDGIIALNKPSGLAVHGGSGVAYGAIEALRAIYPDKEFLELVHRLDRDTSGLLMIADKRSVLRVLHEQLRDGKMQKVYVALLAGRLKGGHHKVTAPLDKNNLASGERVVRVSREGKAAETHFQVIERFANCTLVEARPLTGRTHQIRVHAQFLGHPILGDDKYCSNENNKWAKEQLGLNRLFLHARDLTLAMPNQPDPLTLHCPLAPELEGVVQRLRDVSV